MVWWDCTVRLWPLGSGWYPQQKVSKAMDHWHVTVLCAHTWVVLKSLVTKTCWFDTQIYYTSYFVMVFTHVGTWLWKAMPCRVQGNCPDAWNIYALFVARVVPLHIFLLQYFFAFGPSWSWLLDSGFSKVATDKRVQVILLKLFGKDWKRRFFLKLIIEDV